MLIYSQCYTIYSVSQPPFCYDVAPVIYNSLQQYTVVWREKGKRFLTHINIVTSTFDKKYYLHLHVYNKKIISTI